MHTEKTRDLTPYREFISWVRLSVLPLWHSNGFDDESGAALDQLKLGQSDSIDVAAGKALKERLLQNQAKQIFVFSCAQSMGWGGGYQYTVKRLFEFVSRKGALSCRSDGYVYSLNQQFEIMDARYDLSVHGHFLLACAAAHTALGGGNDVRRASNIMEWLDLHFLHELGGWKESSSKTSVRRLATLGVMFEAFIALYEITKKEAWLHRANECYELFRRYHWCELQHLAYSVCNDHWQMLNSDVVVEEQFQWVCLLLRYSRCGGDVDALMVSHLYKAALNANSMVGGEGVVPTKGVIGANTPVMQGAATERIGFKASEVVLCIRSKVVCDARLLKASMLMAVADEVGNDGVGSDGVGSDGVGNDGVGYADMAAALGALQNIRALASSSVGGFFSTSDEAKDVCSVEVLYEVFQASLHIKTYLAKRASVVCD